MLPVLAGLVAGCAAVDAARAGRGSPLRRALTFHASFDRGTDADFALGDPWLYQAPSLGQAKEARPGLPGGGIVELERVGGRHSGALRFTQRSEAVVFYKAKDNLRWLPENWSGTVSFWLRADLATLSPGFADPVNITSKAWNDAAFFVEFEKRGAEAPFRLGAYADFPVWNPRNRKWEEIPASEKPLFTVAGPPFAGDHWTHVAFTWERFNTGRKDGVAVLFLDGAHAGVIGSRTQTFTWNPAETRIHLGLGYVGAIDDLAVFNRALTLTEIQEVRSLPRGIRSLLER